MYTFDKENIDTQFREVQKRVFRQFKKSPDVEACLFLIGMRELGQVRDKWTKEQKQDLMHIAVCRLLSEEGYYELDGQDQDGWPHWVAVKCMPKLEGEEQEYLLKHHIIRYFDAL